MLVGKPQVSIIDNEVQVSSKVTVNSAQITLPDTLWFSFPEEFHDDVSEDLNGFAVALLPLAMTLGEDLHLGGSVSPHLIYGIKEYQKIQSLWKPTNYTPVSVTYDQLQPAERNTQTSAVGTSFSGGVDSFHTLWRHLPINEPLLEFQITHCLMINGFDADLDSNNHGLFSEYRISLEPALSELDIKLVLCRTNYMMFSDPTVLKHSFGAMVVAPALILGRLFSRFYIPGSYKFDEFFRDGSHLLIDHLIRTETMHTIHDSSHLNRAEKTRVISDWDATYHTLRVCSNGTSIDRHSGTITNCSKCEKCIRTMTTLELLGRLDRYSTFTRKARHSDVWLSYFGQKGTRIHAREVQALAWQSGNFVVWADYMFAFAISFLIKHPRELLRKLHLTLESRSETYAEKVRRLYPRLRRRARWIK